MYSLKQIFNEKVEFVADAPKVDANNPGYKRGGGNAHIFNQKVEFDADPKVDHVNHEYKRGGGNRQVVILIGVI